MIARFTLLALASGLLSMTPLSSNLLPPQLHPIYGGTGGTAFTRSCGDGKVLSGLRFRGGLLVDAIGIMCRSVLASGALGPESSVGSLIGGSGGTSGSMHCSSGQVVTGFHLQHGTYLDQVMISCTTWNPDTRKFGGAKTPVREKAGHGGAGGASYNASLCEAPTQPANGIRGRAHSLIDAIGLICDEP